MNSTLLRVASECIARWSDTRIMSHATRHPRSVRAFAVIAAALCGGFVACSGKTPPPHAPPRATATSASSSAPGGRRAIIGVATETLCVRPRDGWARCWNTPGLFGEPAGSSSSEPTIPPKFHDAVAIAFGRQHQCTRDEEGVVRCVGLNDDGQVGDGAQLLPTVVKAVGSGALALKYAFRASNVGAPILVPTKVGSLRARRLVAGRESTCAITAEGTVQCWGYNGYGQLGDGTIEHRSTPVTAVGVHDAIDLAMANEQTCAATAAGEVWCWGFFADPRASVANSDLVPARLSGLTSVRELAAYESTFCARSDGGAVSCWGMQPASYAGRHLFADKEKVEFSAAPKPLTGVSNALAIAVGGAHVCAIVASGSVTCIGNNDRGQLGLGTDAPTTRAVTVPSIDDAREIAAFERATCVMRADEALWCWGSLASWMVPFDPAKDKDRWSFRDKIWPPTRITW